MEYTIGSNEIRLHGNASIMSKHSNLIESKGNQIKILSSKYINPKLLSILWDAINENINVRKSLSSLTTSEIDEMYDLLNLFKIRSDSDLTFEWTKIKSLEIINNTVNTKGIIRRIQDVIDAVNIYPSWDKFYITTYKSDVVTPFSGEVMESVFGELFRGKYSYSLLRDWRDILHLYGRGILFCRVSEPTRGLFYIAPESYGSLHTITGEPDSGGVKLFERVPSKIIPNTFYYRTQHTHRNYHYTYVSPLRSPTKFDNNLEIKSGNEPSALLYVQLRNDRPTRSGTSSSITKIYELIIEIVKNRSNPSKPPEISNVPYNPNTNYTRRNVIFPIPREIKEDFVAGYLGVYSDEPLRKFIIRPIGGYTEVSQYQPVYSDDYLVVPHLRTKYVEINGVSFLSADLRLLYNTWIYQTLVYTGESKIYLPNLYRQDCILLKELFTGMSPLLYVYNHLSDYALSQLLDERTMISIYEVPVARAIIDESFSPGVNLRDQLKLVKIPEELGKIVRLEELVRIAGE